MSSVLEVTFKISLEAHLITMMSPLNHDYLTTSVILTSRHKSVHNRLCNQRFYDVMLI